MIPGKKEWMWWSLILSLITFYVAIRMWCVCAPVFLKQKFLIQNLLTPWGSTARPHVGCGGDCSLKALFSSCAHCLTTCPRLPCDYVQPCDWVRPMDCVQKCPHHFQAWPIETSHRSSSMLFLSIRLEWRWHPGQSLHPSEPSMTTWRRASSA